MIQIAVYGKGGIGKSTISANLSAALAKQGLRVLQIGCDPKHDSTRLLLGGSTIPTVLDYIRDTLPEERTLEGIVFSGFEGIACVEAGGPEPGVGCAGRGILTTFEELEQLGIKKLSFDAIIYDVLGDVVCGGFAVPIRKGYADAVFLVTSGEYMALYAANNILRGIHNFHGNFSRVAGIIHNERKLEHENERVTAFAKATNLPIVASIPRSECFAFAESEGSTLAEIMPESEPAQAFRQLSLYLKKIMNGSVRLYPAQPLKDQEMEALVLGRKEAACKVQAHIQLSSGIRKGSKLQSKLSTTDKDFLTRSVKKKQPLQGCSFAGAVAVTSQLTDALTIAHGPRSCSHISSHFLKRESLNTSSRYGTNLSGKSEPSLLSTDMGDEAFIFGGSAELISCLDKAAGNETKNAFVITTCPVGLIGDDIEHIITIAEKRKACIGIIPIKVDGNLAGDFSQGIIEGYKAIAGLIDTSVQAEEGWVNIIGEKVLSDNLNSNYTTIRELLETMGIHINCRFLADTDVETIKNFKRAQLNILAYNDDTGRTLKDLLTTRFNAEFFELPFPVGFAETALWIEMLGEIFSKEEVARKIIDQEKRAYECEIGIFRPILKGKTVLISAFSLDLDWIFDTIFDLGMRLVRVGINASPNAADFRSQYISTLPLEYDYTAEKREDDIRRLSPDLVLSNYPPLTPLGSIHHDAIPLSPDVGFRTGLKMARRWSQILRLPAVEGWKLDGGGEEV